MKKIYIGTLTALTLLGAISCKKPSDFGDTNLDPSATTTPVVAALLANVEAALPNYATTNGYAIGPGAYAQYFSESQYPGTGLYTNPTTDFVGVYNGILFDLQNVINLNQDKNSVAVAKIMQSYIFWTLTDAFGDIPYSEALKGIEAITPAYDEQKNIYNGLLSTLKDAVNSMDGGSVPGDLYYGGSAAKWKKMANSLRLLIAIQASKAPDNDFAKTAFAEASADAAGLITTNADNFTLQYPGGGAYNNPWYGQYNGRTDWAESKTVTDLTGSLNDGRTVPFGGSFNDPKQTTGGTVTSALGIPSGIDRTPVLAFIAANPDWALILRADYRQTNSPVVVISASQVLLALAEGANIGWISTANLVTNYRAGINASFEQWGLTAPTASYFTNPNAAVTIGAAANEKNIATQQYLASYPNGHMGWNIWRKTGFPVLVPGPDATNSSKQIVRRFTYAPSEQTTNPAGVNAAIGREKGTGQYAKPGADSQDNNVWWDPGLK